MKKSAYFFALLILLTTVFSHRAQAQGGWSPQAKGAVIGGLGGATAGAIINKRNRAVGGVVGGVAGAGVGYAIGKHRDNKNKERARIVAANRAAAYRAEQAQRERTALAHQASASHSQSSLVANSLAPAAAPTAMSMAPAISAGNSAGYLPNTAANSPYNPYATSEYRRKSW